MWPLRLGHAGLRYRDEYRGIARCRRVAQAAATMRAGFALRSSPVCNQITFAMFAGCWGQISPLLLALSKTSTPHRRCPWQLLRVLHDQQQSPTQVRNKLRRRIWRITRRRTRHLHSIPGVNPRRRSPASRRACRRGVCSGRNRCAQCRPRTSCTLGGLSPVPRMCGW